MGMTLDLPDIDFEKYLDNNENIEQKVQSPGQFADKVLERIKGNMAQVGDTLPWTKTWDKFRFREGELTIWAGVNGNGKSLVMGMCALFFSSPVVIASMEMLPEATIARMVRQATGTPNPTDDYVRHVLTELEGRVWLFNQVGMVKEKALFGMIKYCAQELKVKHIMIDSLVKCGLGVDDYNSQKKFVDKLTALAKEESVHIHLVVHMRKQQNEKDIPDKHSIKGAGEISDLADNVIIVSRNTIDPEKDASKPTGFIRIAKHRHGEWEGNWGFWFHELSQQWITKPNGSALPWPGPNQIWSKK